MRIDIWDRIDRRAERPAPELRAVGSIERVHLIGHRRAVDDLPNAAVVKRDIGNHERLALHPEFVAVHQKGVLPPAYAPRGHRARGEDDFLGVGSGARVVVRTGDDRDSYAYSFVPRD
jgi:hypothetical protein